LPKLRLSLVGSVPNGSTAELVLAGGARRLDVLAAGVNAAIMGVLACVLSKGHPELATVIDRLRKADQVDSHDLNKT
jgi:hypothetical protein